MPPQSDWSADGATAGAEGGSLTIGTKVFAPEHAEGHVALDDNSAFNASLPSLGDDSVQICTLRDLVREGSTATSEPASGVPRLRDSAKVAGAIEAAVSFYRQPPAQLTSVETPRGDLRIRPEHWAEALNEFDPGTPHDEARTQVWEVLLELSADQISDDQDLPHLRLSTYLAG